MAVTILLKNLGEEIKIPVLEILGRIELLLYVPGMRGLSVCWLDGDGIFVSEGAVRLPVYVNIQK